MPYFERRLSLYLTTNIELHTRICSPHAQVRRTLHRSFALLLHPWLIFITAFLSEHLNWLIFKHKLDCDCNHPILSLEVEDHSFLLLGWNLGEGKLISDISSASHPRAVGGVSVKHVLAIIRTHESCVCSTYRKVETEWLTAQRKIDEPHPLFTMRVCDDVEHRYWRKNLYVQRLAKKNANFAKQDPGRARLNR